MAETEASAGSSADRPAPAGDSDPDPIARPRTRWWTRLSGPPGVSMSLAANGAARLVMSLLVGRILGPAALGLYQSGLSGAQLASLLWPGATGSAASAYLAKARGRADPDMLGQVTSHLTKRALQSTVVITIGATAVWALTSRSSAFDVAAFAILVASLCLYAYARGRLYGLGSIARAVLWDTATSALAVALAVVALAVGVEVGLVLLCAAANYAVFAVAGWPRAIGTPVARPTRVELDKFSLYAVLGTLANSGLLQASVLVSGLVGGRSGAGQFSAAFTLATPMTLISSGIAMVLFPRLAHAVGRDDQADIRETADRATRLLTLIMVPAFGLVVILRSVVVNLVWGATYTDAIGVLPYMLFALLLVTIAIPSVNCISSRSSRGALQSATYTLIGVVVCCGIWPLTIGILGLPGVAAGYMIGSLATAGIPYCVVWVQTGQRWWPVTVRIGVGVGLLVLIASLQAVMGHRVGLDLTFAVVFLAAWGMLNLTQIRQLRQIYVR